MFKHIGHTYASEMQQLRTELTALEHELTYTTHNAEDLAHTAHRLKSLHAATANLEDSLKSFELHHLAIVEDRDSTHAELRSALIQISHLKSLRTGPLHIWHLILTAAGILATICTIILTA